MSTNQQNKNNEEEVDLGSLFIIIGKGFSNFFNFIGNCFKGIFHFFIIILIFFKENFVKIGVATLIGSLVGLMIHLNSPKKYSSELLVEPNFESARLLYKNINFYNDLVKQKDTSSLKKIFSFDDKTAAALKEFTIEPIIIENDIINSYDNFIQNVDTATVSSYDYETFKTSFTQYDYKIHSINVVAEKNDIFRKIGNVIIASVVNNEYYSRYKEILNENLNRTDSLFRQNLSQLDSLSKVYLRVLIEEAKKDQSSSIINLGGNEKGAAKELELFNTSRRLNSELKDIAVEKTDNYNTINIISNFQIVGQEIKGIAKNNIFRFALFGASLMVVFLLLIKLNVYLENYKK